MKKGFCFLLLAGLIVWPSASEAAGFLEDTIANIKSQISELESRLQQLQALLPQTNQPSFLDHDYTVGDNGNDVKQLQEFLIEKGFFPLPQATGYFGSVTKQALEAYRASLIAPPPVPVGSVITMATSTGPDIGVATTTVATSTAPTPVPGEGLVAITPPSGAIDARAPLADKESFSKFEFSLEIKSGSRFVLPKANDFVLRSSVESAPTISLIKTAEESGHFSLTIDRPLQPGERLVVEYPKTSSAANFGYLPGDVDQSGRVSYEDLLLLLDATSGAKKDLPLYAVDIDRNGLVNRADQLMWLNLINGSDGFAVWRGRTLSNPQEEN